VAFNFIRETIIGNVISGVLLAGQIFSIPSLRASSVAEVAKLNANKNFQALSKMAEHFNAAANEYELKGSDAFLQKFSDQIFDSGERKFLTKEFKGVSKLPRIEVTQTQFILKYKNKIFVNELKDVENGVFVIDNLRYQYDFSKSVIDNLEVWKVQSKAQGATAFYRFLESLLLPTAEAFTPIMGAVILGIIGAIAGWYIGKKVREANEKKAADHEAQVESARAERAAQAAAERKRKASVTLVGSEKSETPKSDGKESLTSKTRTVEEPKKEESAEGLDKTLKFYTGPEVEKDGKKVPKFSNEKLKEYIALAKDEKIENDDKDNVQRLNNYRDYATWLIARLSQFKPNKANAEKIKAHLDNVIVEKRLNDKQKAALSELKGKYDIAEDVP
jgi:hypothetical protein